MLEFEDATFPFESEIERGSNNGVRKGREWAIGLGCWGREDMGERWVTVRRKWFIVFTELRGHLTMGWTT